MKTDQAITYIKCSTALSTLSALLLDQVTNENKRLKNKISLQSGETLYWVWKIIEGYCDEEKLKLAIEKYKDDEDEV